MLTRLLAALALCVALATTPLAGTSAYADAGCEGASWGVACGVGVPGYGGSGGAAPLKHTGSGSSDPVACVTQEMPPREVPCSNPELGTWSNARACYIKAESPPPPLTDAVWSGNTTGSIYRCSASGIWSGPGSYLFWADSAPGVVPDPRVLAQQAVTQMRLRAVKIGMAPEPSPGSVGLVGLPIWLWVASPDQSTWGPNTKTASAGGYSVTATGKVTRVVWSMGDGGTVACTSTGTSYTDSFGMSASPDCGYRYTKQGTYTVTATSYWTINWSGIGESGVINQTYTSSVVVTIGELQTVVKG
nr:hypothetical protein [Propionicimonas sp.]